MTSRYVMVVQYSMQNI